MAGFRAYSESINVSAGDSLKLCRKEAHHLVRVLRVREGELVTVFDGEGKFAQGTLENSNKAPQIRIESVSSITAPQYRLELIPAVLKGKSMDTLIREVAACGATEIAPILTQQTEARFSNTEKITKLEGWREQLIESAKQSGNLRFPKLSTITDFPAWHANNSATTASNVFLFYGALKKESVLFLQALKDVKEKMFTCSTPAIKILIGPEGDFSPQEHALLEKLGATPVALGMHVLKAGTAAIYATALADQFLRTTLKTELTDAVHLNY